MKELQPTSLYLFIKLTDKVRAIFITGPPIDWTALGVSNIPPLGTILADPVLNFLLHCTMMWQMVRALTDIILTFAMMIAHMAWMIPTTEAKFKDLDQTGALITAGVLPLVYSIGAVLCERFEVGEKMKDKLKRGSRGPESSG
ncbi:hypothetical protein N7471_010422 [Penicillium samsonianum]|uniref:uncharacterized protein n=1 Tax=Penicillium samsonianum TaxID=1882272 RepID=UPI00254731A5|nr:uncharacterized protein N7471_010422 [Penicillium samsonianum]KAJ6125929.1 hypothetical protein N7471_010422 [Penicillium samsonianum]